MTRQRWEPWDDDYLRRLYPHFRCADLAASLGRSEKAVYIRARQLGLSKHPGFYVGPDAGRWNLEKGKGTRFVKGRRPWNKGKHYVAGGRSAQTRFRKGQKPPTWAPVGSERVAKGGILERKVTDTGYPPRDWRSVHVIKWERYRGPVPIGHVVIFRNGNRRDFRLRNLQLVNRADLMRRNSIHNYPPEIKRAMHAVGVLKRVIGNRRQQA